MTLHIRWQIRRDAEQVLAIDEACFGYDAWSRDDLYRRLRRRNVIGLVAELPCGTIAGYMVYEIHKTRLNVLRLAVRPDCMRQGVGLAMVEKLASKLNSRRESLTVEVGERNLPAQLFLRTCGFAVEETIYDEAGGDDVYVFSRWAESVQPVRQTQRSEA